jgi:hypothetical protein
MLSLHPAPLHVHSNPPITELDRKRARMWGLKLPSVAPVVEVLDDRDFTPSEESFVPTLEDEAYWAGYTSAKEGERGWLLLGHQVVRDMGFAFSRGQYEGHRDRQIIEAKELGRELGIISDIACPPGGFCDAEKAAYRKGFAIGQAEFERAVAFEVACMEEDARLEAWIELQERDRPYEITDRDMWPAGCMS